MLGKDWRIVYYVPRRRMRIIARRATMLAGDRSRGAISPASIVASLGITRIVCIGTYSILCDFGAYTSLDILRGRCSTNLLFIILKLCVC